MSEELQAAEGSVDPVLAAEFPGLRLTWINVAVFPGKSPPGVKRRLTELSSRFRGATFIAMRSQAVVHAYRAFFRQIGLDPDTDHVPAERVAVLRLLYGSFKSQGRIADALLVALAETGVPVWAIDARFVSASGPGIRAAKDGEQVGTSDLGDRLAPGRLVVADDDSVYAPLFGDVPEDRAVTKKTERAVLFSVGVPGVPGIAMEEALWLALEVIEESSR